MSLTARQNWHIITDVSIIQLIKYILITFLLFFLRKRNILKNVIYAFFKITYPFDLIISY